MLELTVDRPAQGGRMIARDPDTGARGAGAIVLVAGAIPGERVRARVTERRHGVAFAETVEVIEPSPDRREPPIDPLCGGNLFAHIAYERQLTIKRQMLADAFRRQARLELAALPLITGSPESGYRMRARLHMRGGRLGYYRERTRDVCDPTRSGQLSDAAAAVIGAASEAVASVSDAIHEIALAENTAADTRLLHVTVAGATAPGSLATLARVEGVHGVSASEIGGPVTVIGGLDALSEPMPGGVPVRRRAASFFQANRFLLGPLVSRVVDAAGEGLLADLFAGVGVFAVEAASRGRRVVAVESDRVASGDLAENLREFEGSEAYDEPVEKFLRARALNYAFDVVIVDPPRAGLSTETREGLIDLRPPRIVYVSCDPVTLARDVRALIDAGYTLASLEALDLFPNTPHVESVAVLTLT